MSKAALNMLAIQYARAHPLWRVNSATPGLTATEFTGPRLRDAPTIDELRATGTQIDSVEQGAEIIVQLAKAGRNGPTGTFVGNDGPLLGWLVVSDIGYPRRPRRVNSSRELLRPR
ncbi:hypothetical protein B7R22_16880 [Subtercola boreus]|uniref:SDR family oxidoreductase n=1 Tax=Subtercola boreus TaxID=120213 RepID=A0A3E0VT89_9MICO|nr:hypothetical protein [Subtercola boreus]RFA12107.1 hypothetical protein B7R22_16880 [Subtercola boreus]